MRAANQSGKMSRLLLAGIIRKTNDECSRKDDLELWVRKRYLKAILSARFKPLAWEKSGIEK